MAFREVTVIETKEVLRLWRGGVAKKRIAAQLGVDVKTVRGYLKVAEKLGLDPGLDLDEATAAVVERLAAANRRPRGRACRFSGALTRPFSESLTRVGPRDRSYLPWLTAGSKRAVAVVRSRPSSKKKGLLALWETGVRVPVFQGTVGAVAPKRVWAAAPAGDFEVPSMAAAGPAASTGHFEAVPPQPLSVLLAHIRSGSLRWTAAWASGGCGSFRRRWPDRRRSC